jgi:hypothetical protein
MYERECPIVKLEARRRPDWPDIPEVTGEFVPSRPSDDSEREIHGDPPEEEERPGRLGRPVHPFPSEIDAHGDPVTSALAPWLSGHRED